MKKTIIGYNLEHVLVAHRMLDILVSYGYDKKYFPMEVDVLGDEVDEDGVPLIRLHGSTSVSQYWFIFEEDDACT